MRKQAQREAQQVGQFAPAVRSVRGHVAVAGSESAGPKVWVYGSAGIVPPVDEVAAGGQHK